MSLANPSRKSDIAAAEDHRTVRGGSEGLKQNLGVTGQRLVLNDRLIGRDDLHHLHPCGTGAVE